MNRYAITAVMLLLLSGCVQQPAADYTAYEGQEFAISYPSEWEVQPYDGGAGFLSPQAGLSDTFRENLNVIVSPAGEGATLDGYVADSLGTLEENFEDFDLVDERTVTLGGAPAYSIAYTGKAGPGTVSVFQVLAVKDGNFFVVTYAGTLENFSSYSEEVQKMLDSFRFMSPASTTTMAEEPKAASAYAQLTGKWRVYSQSIYYDTGGSNFLETPATTLLELRPDMSWSFGNSAGTWGVAEITEKDWENWGVSSYGPERKIILNNWNGDAADGPIEETAARVDFIWVIYRESPPAVSSPAQIQMKFGWTNM